MMGMMNDGRGQRNWPLFPDMNGSTQSSGT